MAWAAKAAGIVGAAILGFFVGASVVAAIQQDSDCVSTPTETTCTVTSQEPAWSWLLGGVPAALIFAALGEIGETR